MFFIFFLFSTQLQVLNSAQFLKMASAVIENSIKHLDEKWHELREVCNIIKYEKAMVELDRIEKQ